MEKGISAIEMRLRRVSAFSELKTVLDVSVGRETSACVTRYPPHGKPELKFQLLNTAAISYSTACSDLVSQS